MKLPRTLKLLLMIRTLIRCSICAIHYFSAYIMWPTCTSAGFLHSHSRQKHNAVCTVTFFCLHMLDCVVQRRLCAIFLVTSISHTGHLLALNKMDLWHPKLQCNRYPILEGCAPNKNQYFGRPVPGWARKAQLFTGDEYAMQWKKKFFIKSQNKRCLWI